MNSTLVRERDESQLLIRLFEEAPANHPHFKAEKNEIWWPSEKELWLGLGKKAMPAGLLKTIRLLFHKRKDRWPAQVVVDLSDCPLNWIEAAVNGVVLGGYSIQLYKSDRKPLSPLYGDKGQLSIWSGSADTHEVERTIRKAHETALVQMRIMDLMNSPGNRKPPRVLAEWALESGRQYGYRVTVLEKDALQAMGMHALLSVNKGSMEPPVMILTDYTPAKYQKTIALVGKGITFDTGGISIKPSANMHLMKSDMGGAGAVLGAVELAARLKLPVRVLGIIPSTENCVDGASTKPGDVIDSYARKTIEVIDTDAEGRLVLADGLSYAVRDLKPDVVIDLATLTGSVIQTLGYHAAGLFTNNEQLATQLTQAAEATGERVWRLPIWDEYKEEVSSDIADIKNFHGKPLAGAIVAAKFLEEFTDEHPAWAHLDIAGTAFGDTEFTPNRAGTAYGVRLLRQYLEGL
ncbi:M17 family metallopeptidase [Telluribacter sp. SYSU D00476]|uniref:leucyl aminopeptidase family protein n=1 Tax=Telluribacter sp. SYSU D00476 TaxID=2811430 RepID=UPI001FF2898F|nr:leucyl aminopeptidase family protein [Telluribacter sp. SYSU D00476]